jgi:hypothetical protein
LERPQIRVRRQFVEQNGGEIAFFDLAPIRGSMLHPRLPPAPYQMIMSNVTNRRLGSVPWDWDKTLGPWRVMDGDAAALAATVDVNGFRPAFDFGSKPSSTQSFAWVRFAPKYADPESPQKWDPKTQAWIGTLVQSDASMDYIEATWPAGTSLALSLRRSNQNFVNMHLVPSYFWPGGDHWVANTSQAGCPAIYGVAPNDANDVPSDWCKQDLSSIPELLKNQAVLDRCDINVYRPGSRELHWPVLRERTPFAALFGHVRRQNSSLGFGHSTQLDSPSAEISTGDGDLAYGKRPGPRLHETLDLNWHFGAKDFVDTSSYAPIYAPPTADGYECYVLPENLSSPQFLVDCATIGDQLKTCSDAGYDLNAVDKDGKNIGCSDTDLDDINRDSCSGLGCVWTKTVGWVWNKGSQGLQDLANLWEAAGGDSPVRFAYHRVPQTISLEHEIEYSVPAGAHDFGFGVQTDCGGPVKCDAADFCPSNVTATTAFSDKFGDKPCNGWDSDDNFFDSHDGVVFGPTATLTPMGSGVSEAASEGRFWEDGQFRQDTWPFTVAPGIFQHPSGIYGRAAVHAGSVAAGSLGAREYLSVLGSAADNASIEKYIQGVRNQANVRDNAFRIEFLGDLIADCGHVPIKTELHPPQVVLLHLSAPFINPTIPAPARYSLFGWARSSDSTKGDLVVDLWPNGPRPSANSTLSPIEVRGGEGSAQYRSSESSDQWRCLPYPPAAPSRIRCSLSHGGSNFHDGCDEAPGMRAACATSISGLLTDVVWSAP